MDSQKIYLAVLQNDWDLLSETLTIDAQSVHFGTDLRQDIEAALARVVAVTPKPPFTLREFDAICNIARDALEMSPALYESRYADDLAELTAKLKEHLNPTATYAIKLALPRTPPPLNKNFLAARVAALLKESATDQPANLDGVQDLIADEDHSHVFQITVTASECGAERLADDLHAEFSDWIVRGPQCMEPLTTEDEAAFNQFYMEHVANGGGHSNA